MKCTAKSKRSGQQCQKDAMQGRNVCSMHGGKSLRGVAASNFRHGRYSKALPEKLAAAYHRSMNDPALLNLRSELALIDARLYELAERFKAEEGPMSAGEIRDTWVQIIPTIEARRRLVETINCIDSESHLPADRALAIIGVVATRLRDIVLQMVERPVADAILTAVSKSLSEFVGDTNRRPVLIE